MKVSTKSYPFPVLGNLDDISGIFSPSMDYTLEPNQVILDCNFELENETVEKLIENGDASFYVQLECPSTFYRRTFISSEKSLRIEVPAGDLRDKVNVTFLVCSNVQIPEYNPVGVHPDLEGEPSYVEAGDVLADGGVGFFIADKTFDPLKAPISSFMKINKGTFANGPMVIDYEDEQIIIVLSEEDYDRYLNVKGFAPNTLHSSLVLPALTDVLYTMKYDRKAHEDQPWFGRLQQIIVQQKIDINEPIVAAQQILGQPLQRSLDEIKTVAIGEDD